MLKRGILSREEAARIMERMSPPPHIVQFGVDLATDPPAVTPIVADMVIRELKPIDIENIRGFSIEVTPDGPLTLSPIFEDITPTLDSERLEEVTAPLRERIRELCAQGLTIRHILDLLEREGHNRRELITGVREVWRSGRTLTRISDEEIPAGTLVTVNEEGHARAALGSEVIGFAVGDDMIQFGGNVEMSWARDENRHYGSMMMPMHASVALGYNIRVPREPPGQRVDTQFKYTERFPPEVEAKAMELLRKFVSPEQYTAFIDRANIELENKAGDTRLIINQNGGFTMMKGDRGAGIVLTSGNVRSYRFPLGDEIAAFLDWFRYKTPELIQNWNCGNFGIVRDGIE